VSFNDSIQWIVVTRSTISLRFDTNHRLENALPRNQYPYSFLACIESSQERSKLEGFANQSQEEGAQKSHGLGYNCDSSAPAHWRRCRSLFPNFNTVCALCTVRTLRHCSWSWLRHQWRIPCPRHKSRHRHPWASRVRARQSRARP
jgi:hypothetical protein